MFVYKDKVMLLASDTLETIESTLATLREVGEATVDIDRREIYFSIEGFDLWELRSLLGEAYDRLASYGVEPNEISRECIHDMGPA